MMFARTLGHSTMAAVIAAGCMAAGAAAAQQLTVVSFGGSYQEAQSKALFQPAAKAMGITIKEETYTGIADLRLKVKAGAVTWDIVANQIAKTRYMTDGQVTLPLVIRSANGGGSRFGAQHSQSVENWGMMIPGLKIVAPAFPGDVKGMLAAAIRDDDPVLFFEQKSLYAAKGEVPDGEHFVELGKANVVREGTDVTIVALALMVGRALKAAEILKEQHGISASVVDLRSLVPLDTQTILREVAKTGRLVTVEENPRLCGWGAEIASIVAEELFWDLDGPIVRITTPHVPLAAANNLEDAQLPSAERIVAGVRQLVD